jgi:hypothetical protein
LPGLKSPDKTMSIETEGAYDGVIRLHSLGKTPLSSFAWLTIGLAQKVQTIIQVVSNSSSLSM